MEECAKFVLKKEEFLMSNTYLFQLYSNRMVMKCSISIHPSKLKLFGTKFNSSVMKMCQKQILIPSLVNLERILRKQFK